MLTRICSVLLGILVPALCVADSFKNLGIQISSSTLQGATFTTDPQTHHPLACTVLRGQPAKLVVIDAVTGAVLHSLALEGAYGGWNATTASDNSVYVGTDSNGHLYRYIPGEDAVHDLGQVLNQTWIWDVCAGKNGEIFGSTYPDCLAFRYHPAEGFMDIGRGPLVLGEQYARSITYYDADNMLYAGIGSHAHLIQLNPRTGDKRDILPEAYRSRDFVYTVDVLGDILLAHCSPGTSSIAFDLKSLKKIGTIPNVPAVQISTRSAFSGLIYYTSENKLFSWNPSTPTLASIEIAVTGEALAFTWLDSKLLFFTRNGKIFSYNPSASHSSPFILDPSATFSPPIEPTPLQSLTLGPDGRIWCGGYLSGGAAAYDPDTGKSEQYNPIGQPEDITVLGSRIFFGCYPDARLHVFDITKPWNIKQGNPRQYAELESEGQSRPMAMLAVPELGSVFTGTVPEYGHLGGTLSVCDSAGDRLVIYHDVVHNQSIVTLAYSHGLIVGGTSIAGGLGQEPSEHEARLFLWNPQTHQKIFEITPVPDKTSITGLFIGPDKNVWGFANGTLFVFDPASRRIISRHILFPDYSNNPSWRDAKFVIHPSGQIYGTAGGKFFRLDPATFQITTLGEAGFSHLAMDRKGRIYFKKGPINLWQYTP